MSILKTNAIQTTSGKPILNSTGGVLQVVHSVIKTTWSSVSDGTTFYDVTPYKASITPTSSSNKVLVMMSMHLGYRYWEIQGRITRNGSGITDSYGAARGVRTQCSFSGNNYDGQSTYGYNWINIHHNYLDSPATTSSVEYGITMNGYSSYAIYFNRTSYDYNTSDYYGQPASTITLMEISA